MPRIVIYPFKNDVLTEYTKGTNGLKIAKKLNVPYHQVRHIIKEYEDDIKISIEVKNMQLQEEEQEKILLYESYRSYEKSILERINSLHKQGMTYEDITKKLQKERDDEDRQITKYLYANSERKPLIHNFNQRHIIYDPQMKCNRPMTKKEQEEFEKTNKLNT